MFFMGVFLDLTVCSRIENIGFSLEFVGFHPMVYGPAASIHTNSWQHKMNRRQSQRSRLPLQLPSEVLPDMSFAEKTIDHTLQLLNPHNKEALYVEENVHRVVIHRSKRAQVLFSNQTWRVVEDWEAKEAHAEEQVWRHHYRTQQLERIHKQTSNFKEFYESVRRKAAFPLFQILEEQPWSHVGLPFPIVQQEMERLLLFELLTKHPGKIIYNSILQTWDYKQTKRMTDMTSFTFPEPPLTCATEAEEEMDSAVIHPLFDMF